MIQFILVDPEQISVVWKVKRTKTNKQTKQNKQKKKKKRGRGVLCSLFATGPFDLVAWATFLFFFLFFGGVGGRGPNFLVGELSAADTADS